MSKLPNCPSNPNSNQTEIKVVKTNQTLFKNMEITLENKIHKNI